MKADFMHDIWIIWLVSDKMGRFYCGAYATESAAFKALETVQGSDAISSFDEIRIQRELVTA